MAQQIYEKTYISVLAGDTVEIDVHPEWTNHQIRIEKGTASAGTLALTDQVHAQATAEPVNDIYGAAISVSMAASSFTTRAVENRSFSKLIITPTGLNGTYHVFYRGWK